MKPWREWSTYADVCEAGMKDYLLQSMNMYDKLKTKYEDRRNGLVELHRENGDELTAELIGGICEGLARLEVMRKEGYFTAPENCNEHGIAIDWPRWDAEQREKYNEALAGLYRLLKAASTPRQLDAVEAKISETQSKLLNFSRRINSRGRIGIKRKIELLMEDKNNERGNEEG